MTKKKVNMLLAGAVALSVAGLATQAKASAEKEGYERCYGVVKAGMNDCANATNSHGCAAQAAADNDKNEWLYVPEGMCDKLAGGSKMAADGKMHEEGMDHDHDDMDEYMHHDDMHKDMHDDMKKDHM